ncbi:MAG: endopeptidase La [Bacillota bacterium]
MVKAWKGAGEYPLIPLRGMLVFPSTIVPLEVGRQRSVSALDEAMSQDRFVVLATQRETRVDEPGPGDIFPMGTIAEIKQMARLPGGNLRAVVEGIGRCEILEYTAMDPHIRVTVREFPESLEHDAEIEALVRTVKEQYEKIVKMSKKVPAEALIAVSSVQEPGKLADTVGAQMALKLEDKQALLHETSIRARLERVLEFINREIDLMELEKRISGRVKKQIERTQKEFYLREQMKAIQKELGDKDDKGGEVAEFRQKIQEANLPAEIEEKALKEVDRLEKMPPMAAEAVVVRTYLEWIVALPWNVETEDRLDINEAERILNEDHYGLDKVKERVLEYLAVRQLVKSMKGPILCLVGPPGVGKTSLAKSVARALGRKFARISLGGVRDEAEIRGHRRTYVGALPGRILHGMRQAGSKNPVFLMDEIDKLTSDFRGDPAAALLEVLDPEQNLAFSDHYLEMPFDLSKVMFITTANSTHNIPKALLDRMETIFLPGYTEEEKIHIGRLFLLPKQMKEHGLAGANLEVSDNAIKEISRRYTREAGVRNLERELATICRKVAKELVKGETEAVRVNKTNLTRYLGIPRYRYGTAEKKDEIGIATGVAVTDTGGDLMPIEVTLMMGKGNLMLTGKLGDVMKESAQAAFSYVRSRAHDLGVDEGFHEKYDVHIHVPEGAIPKDGPSAGIAIASALASALTGIPVRHDVAMTGEVTLRGRVLPVGGVKEKTLAVFRAGIRTMILPEDNRKDLDEVARNVTRRMRFILVDHMDEVLRVAMLRPGFNEGRQSRDCFPIPEPATGCLPMADQTGP